MATKSRRVVRSIFPLLVVMLLGVLWPASSCGSSVTTTTLAVTTSAAAVATTSVAQSTSVGLEATATCANDVVRVDGTATVPDGAYVAYEVGDALVDSTKGFPDLALRDGNTQVSNGKFSFEADISDFPASMQTIEVWIGFQTVSIPAQPASVIALYGESGEKMTGSDVVKSGDLTRAELILQVPR